MNKPVYHGSPYDIESISAHISTHRKECIYATDNKAVAMMFMGRGNGDLDTIKEIKDGMPVLVERREGVLEKIYNKPGYIYELDGTTFEHYDYLWSPEVISFEKEISPLKKDYYENILEALYAEERLGNIKIYRYPNRPNEVPLDNSDLVDKYIHYYNIGINDAVEQLLLMYPEFNDLVAAKIEKSNIIKK